MGGKFVDGKFIHTPDPEVWELKPEQVKYIVDEIEQAAYGVMNYPRVQIMIDSEGVKFKVEHMLAVWTQGFGRKVE